MPHNYYLARAEKILRQFDHVARSLRPLLAARYGEAAADEIVPATRRELAALLPELPYIGGRRNPATRSLIGTATGLALYHVLKARGEALETIGRLYYELAEAYLSSLPRPVRFVQRQVMSLLGTPLGRGVMRRLAAESQKGLYPDGPVLSYVEGDGETFDWGIDYTVCPIHNFFRDQGAAEFAPYVCLYDFPKSRLVSGSGLVRTTTLAEGGARCDMRIKRGGPAINRQKTRLGAGPDGRVPPEEDTMRILVYGAGVLGSLYAARLRSAGHDVALLARGRRLDDLRAHGVVIVDALTAERTTTHVPLVEQLAPEDAYDLVLVVMRAHQVAGALPALAANRRTPNVVFMGNNAAGPADLIAALGRERVLLGFGSAGGWREGPVVRCLWQMGKRRARVTLGELDGQDTPRLRRIAAAFERAGFPVVVSPHMDAWLKSHAALVLPLAGALYAAGGDNYRLARTRDAVVLAVRAIREGFAVLRKLGIPLTPPALWLYARLPEPLLVPLARRYLDTKVAEIALAGHANAARDEIKSFADDFRALGRTAALPMPAWDRLYAYIDPAVPPLAEGSAALALDWRGLLGVGAGVLAGLVLLGKLRRSRR